MVAEKRFANYTDVGLFVSFWTGIKVLLFRTHTSEHQERNLRGLCLPPFPIDQHPTLLLLKYSNTILRFQRCWSHFYCLPSPWTHPSLAGEVQPQSGSSFQPSHKWTSIFLPNLPPSSSTDHKTKPNKPCPCLLSGTVDKFSFPQIKTKAAYWASLVVQSLKNLPAMQETWVPSLDWEDPLEKGLATHSNILTWRILMDRGDCRATVHRIAKNQTQPQQLGTHTHKLYY